LWKYPACWKYSLKYPRIALCKGALLGDKYRLKEGIEPVLYMDKVVDRDRVGYTGIVRKDTVHRVPAVHRDMVAHKEMWNRDIDNMEMDIPVDPIDQDIFENHSST
jgi:hypothetical protein